MKYFYLAHSVMSLVCLKDLVSENSAPGLVIIHKDRNMDKLKIDFYDPIKIFCEKHNIEIAETENINEVKDKLLNYDLGICVGFMDILKNEIYTIPDLGILNLHCGKLPEYRGRAPISRSIINGEKFLTVTVHRIVEGVDSGDICKEHKIEIRPGDDVNTLYEKCSAVSSEIILKCFKDLIENKLIFQKQSSDLPPNRKISAEERKIDWQKNSLSCYNKIRALTFPYPCAYSVLNDKTFLFLKAKLSYAEDRSELSGGTIIKVNTSGMRIKTGSGELKILEICDEYFNKINISGHFKAGDKFE